MSKKPAKRKPSPKTVRAWFGTDASGNILKWTYCNHSKVGVAYFTDAPTNIMAREFRLVPVKPKRKAKP